jgi:hypothetical protein
MAPVYHPVSFYMELSICSRFSLQYSMNNLVISCSLRFSVMAAYTGFFPSEIINKLWKITLLAAVDVYASAVLIPPLVK